MNESIPNVHHDAPLIRPMQQPDGQADEHRREERPAVAGRCRIPSTIGDSVRTAGDREVVVAGRERDDQAAGEDHQDRLRAEDRLEVARREVRVGLEDAEDDDDDDQPRQDRARSALDDLGGGALDVTRRRAALGVCAAVLSGTLATHRTVHPSLVLPSLRLGERDAVVAPAPRSAPWRRLAPVSSRTICAAAEHDDAVADRGQLLVVGARAHDRRPALRRRADACGRSARARRRRRPASARGAGAAAAPLCSHFASSAFCWLPPLSDW